MGVTPIRVHGVPLIASPARQTRPKKSLGQNFLVDRRVLARIMQAAEVCSEDTVVEIGPGRGILTRELAKTAAAVVAVEMDDELAAALTSEFEDRSNVRIVHADARDVDINSLVEEGRRYKLAANLPYYAALPIVRRFLESERKPSLMVFMVQREVARSMTAAPGEMSLLSVATQLYGEARIVVGVQPGAFRPAPKVTSAIVRIDLFDEPAIELDSIEAFFTLVRAGFSAPRKQVHNCLQQGLGITREQSERMLVSAGIDPKRRPQTLSLDDWGGLHEAYSRHSASAS